MTKTTTIPRRSVLAAAVITAFASPLAFVGAHAQAQPADWPTKPVRIVVGFAAGSPPDIFARMYGDYASKKLGVPFVVDNKPGSAGNLAGDTVAKANADGYTILYNVSTAFTINPFMYAKLPFDAGKDLVPVATTMRQGLVLVSRPDFQAKSLQEMAELSRTKPGTISHASYGAGSPSHLIMEWMKDEARINMLHVPYRASPMNELIGGQVDLLLEPMATAYPMVASGRVKAVAYSGPQRHTAMPNVPTFAESIPGLSMMSWHGIWAPAATPPAVVERLHATWLAASKDSDVQRRIKELNSEPLGVSRAEMGEMIRRDSEIYGRIVKARNIRVD
jgi:tripartite-type tricarboxylate transporter receptor subunit TctC